MSLRILVILFLFVSGALFAQLPKKVKSLEGVWEYKNGSGFESWKIEDNMLKGETFRYTRLGDSIHVEDLKIKLVNEVLIHTIEQYSISADSSVVSLKRMVFIGGRRKMNFINSEAQVPYAISYKFGFLNRRKLKVFIQYGSESNRTKIVLEKLKA